MMEMMEIDGDGVPVQEALNLLVSWGGFSEAAPEGTALGLSSPLPYVGKTLPPPTPWESYCNCQVKHLQIGNAEDPAHILFC